MVFSNLFHGISSFQHSRVMYLLKLLLLQPTVRRAMVLVTFQLQLMLEKLTHTNARAASLCWVG